MLASMLRPLLFVCALVATVTAVPARIRREPKLNEVPEHNMNKGCFQDVTRTYNETIDIYDYATGEYTKVLQEVNVTTQKCCSGFAGDDCDISITEDAPSCGNATCPHRHDAHCVTITHCGKNIELFLDQSYLVIKECAPKNICLGACRSDPCHGLTCAEYPQALCFTDCDCGPLWILPQGRKRVQCSSHSQKRDAADFCM